MKKIILHIDDESAVRDVLAACLDTNGYQAISAASLGEALKIVAQHRPDLVICDLQLNQGDGWEAVDELKAILPETPVLLLSGVLIDPQIARKVLGHKVSAYVEKTAPLARILEEVRRLTGG